MKKKSKQEYEDEPEYLVLDVYARVFAGLERGGEYVFSENMDEAKPLQGQEKFDFMKRNSYLGLEQIFLKNVREKRSNRKTRISI
jgi:hypothetical protein